MATAVAAMLARVAGSTSSISGRVLNWTTSPTMPTTPNFASSPTSRRSTEGASASAVRTVVIGPTIDDAGEGPEFSPGHGPWPAVMPSRPHLYHRAVTFPVVGMIGGGQLARMAHQAAIPLGVRFRLLADTPQDSASLVVNDVVLGDYRDLDT